MTGIDIDVEAYAPTAVITLGGELDLASCPDVRAAAALTLQRPEVAEIVIDLAAVTFLDSTALGCLLDLRKVTAGRNIGLRLRGLQPGPTRIFKITGLDTVFEMEPADPDPARS